ncbi:hypothetical protein ACSLPA_25485, partial [Escherichia coli]
ALTFQNHTDCPLTDFRGKTNIFSHPVYLFLRKFSLQDSRGGSNLLTPGSVFLPSVSWQWRYPVRLIPSLYPCSDSFLI